MSTGAFSLFEVAVLCGSAALLMSIAALQKHLLRRKETRPRCSTCGRVDRYNCACRR